MLRYELLRFAKFAGVLTFAGGAIASLLATELAARRVAVHRVASFGLLVTWVAGYLLADLLARPLSSPWLLGGFALSFVLQGVLTWSVADDGRRGLRVTGPVVGLLAGTLALMIWRPTWAMVGL
ncbi:MAG TPA: hypothetical protein VM734_02980 [Kofleriaceae bacterium]|nr:hypothetical protein [Kofleriaceae bacterium]